MEKTKISESFGRAAAAYDALAVFQKEVNGKMRSLLPMWLPKAWEPARVLDGGCGTGFGTANLADLWPNAMLTGCDLSDAMVEQMHRKGFTAVQGDLENLPFTDTRFDFIWSALALQWCQPQRVFHEFYRVLAPKGMLYFSTLLPGTLREIYYAFAGWDGARRGLDFYPIVTLKKLLAEAGFTGIRLMHETHIMHYPDVRSALASIRGIGAGQSLQTNHATLGKTAWRRIQERYESLRDKDGLPITYELLLGCGFR